MTKEDAQKAFDLFIKTYEAKFPKAVLCLQKDRSELRGRIPLSVKSYV